MAYVDPVTAAFAMARGRLANAAQEPPGNVPCGRLLARALEFAAHSVLMAWDFPVKVTKVQQHFEPVLAAYLEPHDADLIRAVWAAEGKPQPDLYADDVVAACTAAVTRLEALAGSPPPSGWAPPPVPPSIGWAGLSGEEQQVLTRVRQCALSICPQARVVLFGSRANGTGSPGSDYDLLVILPDDVEQSVRFMVMGDLYSLARQLGTEFDREHISLSTWHNPDAASRVLVDQAKICGIEVPDSTGDS
jgi:predicted nucleotidyltransferase